MIDFHLKTKYTSNYYQDAPKLENSYGSLNNLLNILLCEGFNKQSIVSIVFNNELKTAIINVEAGHGFNKEQVIELEGVPEELNKQFRIKDIKPLSLEVAYKEDEVFNNFTGTGATVKVAPLGFTRIYNNTTNSVSCYKNKSILNPGILKVIDELPPNGYSTDWSKYARICMGISIDESGEFIDNKKSPQTTEHPYPEKYGDGSSGSGGIHGFAKWRYASNNDSYSRENYTPSGDFPRKWELIGDDKTFYLFIYDNQGTSCCGFGNLFSNKEGFNSLVLQAQDRFIAANSTAGSGYYNRHRNYWGNLLYSEEGSFILTNIYGGVEKCLRYHSTGFYVGSSFPDRPWNSISIRNHNEFSGNIVSSVLGVKDTEGFVRGHHRGFKILYGNDYSTTERLIGTPYRTILLTDPLRTGDMPLLFTMEDWEHIE